MDVLMPQLGETVAEGKITKWFKQAGDDVKPGENLFEIETDKTSMEVPSTVAGKLTAINFKVGDVAKVGAVVAVIGGDGVQALSKAAAPSAAPIPPFAPAKAGVQSQELGRRFRGDERDRATALAYGQMDPFREVRTPEKNYGPANVGGRQVTPLARRLAGERGIDLANIKGSGPHGRIVAGDIGKSGATTGQTAAAPHLYLAADVEIERLLALCSEANSAAPKDKNGEPAFTLSLNDFAIKAWAMALQRVPAAKAAHSKSSGIGVALLLDGEIVTPVIRNAEAKSLTAISAEMRDLAARARERALKPEDSQGGSSTISNPGIHGIREFAAPVRPQQFATLGLGASRRAPVEAGDGSIKFISMMTVTLSCDHRIIGEAAGAQLLATFKAFAENPVTALI